MRTTDFRVVGIICGLFVFLGTEGYAQSQSSHQSSTLIQPTRGMGTQILHVGDMARRIRNRSKRSQERKTASGNSALTMYCPASTISEIFRSTHRLEST
jgi:hypothetical protein